MSPFAWQGNKALFFYFTQNSIPEIYFSTGVERPYFQHHQHQFEKIWLMAII